MPSAIAPLETITTSRPSRASVASWRHQLPIASASTPRPSFVTRLEPTLTTMRRAPRNKSFMRRSTKTRIVGSRLEARIVFGARPLETNVRLDDIEVRREFAISKDGTKVPVNIVFKKGLKLDGSNPLLLTGYGGFAVSMQPRFSLRTGEVLAPPAYEPVRTFGVRVDRGRLWIRAEP